MNTRIAKMVAAEMDEYWEGAYADSGCAKDRLTRFAEMIVSECIKVAQKQRNPANLNYSPCDRFVEDLKQHFGEL